MTTDLLAQLRAGGPKLPSALTAPGALTTVEGAARALAAAPWPAGFASTLAREVDTLVPEPGARYAVRSSASIEDKAGALAAGLFLSRVDVARGEVLEAVRAVLGSAISPAAVAYLAQHDLSSDNLDFAVLIHEFVQGDAAGAAAFDPTRAEPPTIEIHAGKEKAIEGARARPHRGGGARAGEDRRAGRAGVGRRATAKPRSCSCGRCNRRSACRSARSSRCRRSIRCPRRRTAI